MQFKRRDALKVLGGATLATLVDPVFAKAKPLKVLILGGTGFIGPHFVDALTAGGHKVTLFNRGKRDPEVREGIEQLLGDRDGQIDALKGRDWDVVIDNSGYKPSQVRLTTELLEEHVKHYIFISSIAVYTNFAKAGIDEDYELATLKDPTDETVTGETYGGLKVLCEKIVESVLQRSRHHHPAYLHRRARRPHRPVYLLAVARVQGRRDARARHAQRSVPVHRRARPRRLHPHLRREERDRQVQPLRPAGRRHHGFAARGSQTHHQGQHHVCLGRRPEFLTAQEIIGEKAKGNFMPIWQPPVGDEAGLLLVSPARARKKGLKFRSLETTIRDTLEWQKTRPEENQVLKAGLTMEREKELLGKLKSG